VRQPRLLLKLVLEQNGNAYIIMIIITRGMYVTCEVSEHSTLQVNGHTKQRHHNTQTHGV